MTKTQHAQDNHLRNLLLEAIGLDNSQCDLPLTALIQKVVTERKDLVESWGDSNGKSGTCLTIEEENGDEHVLPLSGDEPSFGAVGEGVNFDDR